MNVERLERAVSVMQRVRDHALQFDMARWTDPDRDPYDCHSAACFLGWCARDEVLHAAGLKFRANKTLPSVRMVPHYEMHIGAIAAARFFDIHERDAIRLCQPDIGAYVTVMITPDHVIEWLRELLTNGQIKW